MVKRKKTKHNRIILGVSSFAALEVRLTIGISPGYNVKPFGRPLAGDELRVKILNVQVAAEAKIQR
jgi:hypothetical protein